MKFKKVITFIMTTLLIVLSVCSCAAEPSYAEDLKTIRDNKEITGQVVPLSDSIVGDTKNKDDFSKFTDIKNGAWYYNAAKWCYENDVMSGTSNTTFAPGLTVTRAMIVTCLAKIDGVEKSDYPTCHFSDCKDDSWYSPYVEWAYGKGITAGTSATHFSPNFTLTREQLATILYAYAGYAGYDAAYDEQTLDIYNDSSSISRWAVSGMAWSVGNGIISGTSSTTISPKKGCTRAEMAQMLYKFFENKDKPEQEPEPVSSAALEELINSGCILQKTPLPNEFISRADFAADIIHFTGFDVDIDYYALRGKFFDMTANDRAAATAEIAVGQGYLIAADGLFEPDKPITYSDAVRALLYAVGYREYCEAAGYFTLAHEIGLLNGMSNRAENSAHITYAEFGVLAKNAVNLELVQCVNLAGEHRIVKRGRSNTLKTNFLDRNNGSNEWLFHIANIGWDIFTGGGCRFGASMIINDDGTIDAWLAGLSDDDYESDWGYYRRSYDGGLSWTADITALRPTYGTSDWRWTCDPGVVKIGDYYYCGYTSISWADGLDNNMFITRSKDPTDFFDEKWDGYGWSGKAEPAIVFDGEYSKWGTGEPCFVVKNGVIYCYVTWKSDYNAARVYTAPADDPEWPGKLKFAGTAYLCKQEEDSCDVKYIDAYGMYMAVATASRFTDNSYIRVHTSYDGITFREENIIKSDNAILLRKIHNMGITGTSDGHLDITKQNYISYAYAAADSSWGDWHTRLAPITWLGTDTYGNEKEVISHFGTSNTDYNHSLEVVELQPTRFLDVSEQRKVNNFRVKLKYADGRVESASAEQIADIEFIYDTDLLTINTAKMTVTSKNVTVTSLIKLKYKGVYSYMIVTPARSSGTMPTIFYPETKCVTLDRLNMIKQPSFIATDGHGNYLHLWGGLTSYTQSQQWLFNNNYVANWRQYVTFTDYDPAIISVDPDTGIITPRAAGITTFTAEYCGMTASITVTVDESCFE